MPIVKSWQRWEDGKQSYYRQKVCKYTKNVTCIRLLYDLITIFTDEKCVNTQKLYLYGIQKRTLH